MFRWTALAVFLAALGIILWRARGAKGKAPVARVIATAPLVLGTVAAIAYPPSMQWASMQLPPGIRWVGLAVGVLAVIGVHGVFTTFRRRVVDESARAGLLVTTGPYRWVRHPMYLVMILLFAGLGAMLANGLILSYTAALWLALSGFVVPREEARLAETFGDEYDRYRQHAGAFLPRLMPSGRRRDRQATRGDLSTGEPGGAAGGAVGSPGHTALLLTAMVAMAVWAALSRAMEEWPRTLSEPGARTRLYVHILTLQWAWVGYVWFGIRRAGGRLRALIDPAPWTARRWALHAGVGLAGLAVWLVVGAALGALLAPDEVRLRGVAAMLPHAPVERVVWVVFALSAGIGEEIVYRGYLMKQFTAAMGSRLPAVLLQAVVYGGAHLALPLEMVVSVTLLGLLLGVVAAWRGSLVPGMILHSATGLMAVLGPPGPQ